MQAVDISIEKSKYIFQFPWETVVKGFLQKYPHKELQFVKFNHIIDMQIGLDDNLILRRLMYSKFQSFVWLYTIEDISISFDKQLLEMKTEIVKKSSLFPPFDIGREIISYAAFGDKLKQTLYSKSLAFSGSSFIQKFMDKFNNSFQKGCKIIEEKCEQIIGKTKDEK